MNMKNRQAGWYSIEAVMVVGLLTCFFLIGAADVKAGREAQDMSNQRWEALENKATTPTQRMTVAYLKKQCVRTFYYGDGPREKQLNEELECIESQALALALRTPENSPDPEDLRALGILPDELASN